MKIRTVEFRKTFNLGNYQSQSVGFIADLDDDGDSCPSGVYCMNNKKQYGDTIYSLSMGDAIEKGILTNYRIITPLAPVLSIKS